MIIHKLFNFKTLFKRSYTFYSDLNIDLSLYTLYSYNDIINIDIIQGVPEKNTL